MVYLVYRKKIGEFNHSDFKFIHHLASMKSIWGDSKSSRSILFLLFVAGLPIVSISFKIPKVGFNLRKI